MATAEQHTELNPLQVSLLRLFNRPMSDEETFELKKAVGKTLFGHAEKEVSKVVVEKGYTRQDFEDMLNAES